MQYAYQESLVPHTIVIMMIPAIMTSGTCVLGGTIATGDPLMPLERLGYCALYTGTSWPICYSLSVVTLYLLRFRALHEIVLSLLIVALFGASASTAMVHLVATLVRGHQSTTANLLALYLIIATITVPCSMLLFYLAYQRVKFIRVPDLSVASSAATAPHGDVETTPNAAARELEQIHSNDGHATESETGVAGLPHELEGDVIYLKSEDHYVYVHTVTGCSLIKMRLSDAVAGLGDRGVQVHRSYWVSRRHIQELVKRDRQVLLRLTRNHEVPVSSRYREVVRAILTM